MTACLPVVDMNGLVVIRHANCCTARSHWRTLSSPDPSQIEKSSPSKKEKRPNSQEVVKPLLPIKVSLIICGARVQCENKSWAYPLYHKSRELPFHSSGFGKCVFVCVLCPGLSSGALCEENTRCRMWSLILSIMPWQHPLSGRHMQGGQILRAFVCVCELCVFESWIMGPCKWSAH